jgi:hypothetical protein
VTIPPAKTPETGQELEAPQIPVTFLVEGDKFTKRRLLVFEKTQEV